MHRFKLCVYCLSLVIALIVWTPGTLGQAPPAIQIFMPDGSLPTRNMRLTLTRDDGRIETVFTDTKGKFQVTGDLIREADYIVTVESDGRTFDTTTARLLTPPASEDGLQLEGMAGGGANSLATRTP